MKITVIGGGNVGGLTAMRLAQEQAGEVYLIDIAKGLAQGKSLDMEDARALLKNDYAIIGSEDFGAMKDSGVIVITAGFARKPGMTREELLNKNAQVMKSISEQIKTLAPQAIIVVVTNPLDLMTRFVLRCTGFKPARVIGMGVSLDAGRFANLIAGELKVSPLDVDPCVVGSHGEGMLPLSRFTKVKGVSLDEFCDEKKVEELTQKTVNRGLEIVTLLGSGSAYFAPSAAITALVKAIVKDEKRVIGVSAYLNGEYGLKDLCIGVPCRIGKAGIESIVTLDLNDREKSALAQSAVKLNEQYGKISV